eukprot:474500-Pleurochrysis_carterae.AAC.1
MEPKELAAALPNCAEDSSGEGSFWEENFGEGSFGGGSFWGTSKMRGATLLGNVGDWHSGREF